MFSRRLSGCLEKPIMSDVKPHLAARCQQLKEIGERLTAIEKTCAGIAALDESEADVARRALADARSAFAEAHVHLLHELDVASLSDPAAARVSEILSSSYLHPSARNALAIVRLTEALGQSPEEAAAAAASGLPEKLRDTMRRRGDNKKSAAGEIGISTKTLDRLLSGKPTKPVKQRSS
jgi:hypothetical protein